ncbi:MAG TPA: tetratricopeptide repeat protein [Vicinamibacterales bacterium]|nr:tetratricopeptide repeat protein [Vicinamibacterales bacterium]
MRRAMCDVRGTWGLLLVAAVLAGCAPKVAPPVIAPGAPRYPEFVFPGAAEPPEASVLEAHDLAWQVLQAGDARAAERQYTALLKRVPGFYPAHAGLGYTALSREDYESALAHFDRALAVNPAYAPALAGKGQTYLATRQRDQALASFDAALAADPGLTAIRSAADVLRFQGLQGGVAGAREAAAAGRWADARAGYIEAITASPESPFLYRELAVVERQDGRLPEAMERIETAIALDPNDSRSFVVLADVYESMGELEKAASALTSATALEPSAALDERIEALRAKLAFEAMPPEFRAIEQATTVTRAQLAALIGIRLEALVKRAPRRNTAVMTDTRGNWAAQWILPVARAGFMEVYLNHTFQPSATVRRGDLAFAVSNILTVIAAENPRLGASWRNARRRFSDLPPGHLSHAAASMAVEAGVMQPLEDDAFHLSRPVTGAEAVAAIKRLAELADRRR